MKKILLVLSMVFLVGCGKDKTTVISNDARVSDLEARMALNEQLDAARDVLIAANSNSIASLSNELTTLESELLALLLQEEQARIAGDQQSAAQLSSAIAAQSLVNSLVQLQIASLNGKILVLNNKTTSLQNQINNLSSSLSDLQIEVTVLTALVGDLQDQLNGIDLDVLETSIMSQVTTLISNSSSNSVEVVKPCSNAAEVLLLIDGVFYGTMNHTTGAGNNGVLKSVALEPLNNQTYSTTSSSGNCTFTVNNGTIQ